MAVRRAHTRIKTPRAKKPIVLKAHHQKPYRKRQVLFLLVSIALLIVLLLKIGAWYGRKEASGVPVVQTTPTTSSISVARSSYGFSLAFDANSFGVTGTVIGDDGTAHSITSSDLVPNSKISTLTLKPRQGTVERPQAASELVIQMAPTTDVFDAAKQAAPVNATAGEIAAKVFPESAPSGFDITTLSTKADTLNGVPVLKSVYQYTPKFNGGNSYAIVWTGVSDGRAFAVKLQGLVGSSAIPDVFSSVLESLTIASDQGVKGAFTTLFAPKVSADPSKLNPKYLSDDVSPAVVKIYHIVCGTLTTYGHPLLPNSCTGFSGSGFLATSTGYIATNGHVVVYSAKDRLVDILTANTDTLDSFLQGLGMTSSQIATVSQDPAALASIISKIYDIPDADLLFTNSDEVTLVSLGDTVPYLGAMSTSADLKALKTDTTDTRVAKIVAYNYSSKDMLTAIADPEQGFTASDVALLKINVSNAPTIAISHQQTTQNEKIFIMGFPADADNSLTDNNSLSVSVTDGVISSIRQAAGGFGKLYQSDADASHGNSGGPAIDETGGVIGLLTYREAADSTGNAAKSYIRDINDFVNLAKVNNVTLDSTSTTQALWQQGLELYSESHYSAALKDFRKVSTLYPSHRLVAAYVDSAKTAIDDGKDVQLVPISLVIVVLLLTVGAVVSGVVMIVRHRVRHHLYLAYQPVMPDGVPAPEGFVVTKEATRPAASPSEDIEEGHEKPPAKLVQ